MHSTYLAFGLGVALAAPLPTYLKLYRDENDEVIAFLTETAVFNLSGESSSGKSSVCLAAISLGGSPERAGTLDFSPRGLAELASDSNDLALVLDDTEKAEDGPGVLVRALKGVIHTVPGGRSKIISRGADQSRFPQLRWSTFGLSSSPRPIAQIAAENHWEMSPGDKVRLFDISVPGPAKGGIFDRIDGTAAVRAKRSVKLIAKLERGYANHHGRIIPQWVLYLMRKDRSKRIVELTDELMSNRPVATVGKALCTQIRPRIRRDGVAGRSVSPAVLLSATARKAKPKLGSWMMPCSIRWGSKKGQVSIYQKLQKAGLVADGHGHAGTVQERIPIKRHGKIVRRPRLWVINADDLGSLRKPVSG